MKEDQCVGSAANGTVRIFVYGALMGKLEGGTVGRVLNHRVAFVAKGLAWLEPSFASLELEPDGTAHGLVVEVPTHQWAKWRQREAGYNEVEVTAHTASGSHRCRALQIASRYRAKERPPSARYAHLLHSAALEHAFPREVRQRYAQLARSGPRLTMRCQGLVSTLGRLVPYLGLWGTLGVACVGLLLCTGAALVAAWLVVASFQ